MSNRLTLLLVSGFFILSACGPSAEEKAAAEKRIQDSVAAAKVQMEAAMEAARQQMVEDSIAAADSSVINAQ